MAHILNFSASQVGIKWIFNVSFPVGPNCTNARDDVMLVQHAINTLSAAFSLKNDKGEYTKYLTRDGIFGPLTAAAIVAFQKQAKEVRRKHISTDGRVDPSNGTGWSGTNNQYTIVYLNRDHLEVHGKMMQEPQMPQYLQACLKKNKPVG